MAAAQAAAEAAMQEALAQEASSHCQAMEGSNVVDMQLNDEMQLLQAMQAAGMGGQMDMHQMASEMEGQLDMVQDESEVGGQMDMLQELLAQGAASGADESTMQSLLQMLAQQEQEEQLAAAEAEIQSRPDEHYITIAQNGTILEATKMVTGFPPDALLMTSTYDNIYDEDLPGLLCVKTKFWDKGVGDVHAYIRRRSVEGDWIWLESRAVSYVDLPVPGIIIQETRANDDYQVQENNRITRILSIVVQAVEAAQLNASKIQSIGAETAPDGGTKTDLHGTTIDDNPNFSNDDAASSSMAHSSEAAGSMGNDLQTLFGASKGNHEEDPVSKLEHELMDQVAKKLENEETGKSAGEKTSFDPFSIMEAVREGVSLDLGMTQLFKDEVKIIALVLTGSLSVDDLPELILSALQSGEGVAGAVKLCELAAKRGPQNSQSLSRQGIKLSTPPISVINLSCTYIGNRGIEILSSVLYCDNSFLKTIDVSFCGIDDKGFIALAKALSKRKRRGMSSLRGIILSGNYISSRAATELGSALAPETARRKRSRARPFKSKATGYEQESCESDDDNEDYELDNKNKRRVRVPKTLKAKERNINADEGLQMIHMGSVSITTEALSQFLHRLGPKCTIRELNLSSNALGPEGARILADFLQGAKGSKDPVMPFLDRLDLSNNKLGDDGTSKLTRVIAKRGKNNFVDLRLSCNGINAAGVEIIMNKLLHHNLISLSLNKNSIGDQGCQLVAASLQSMKSLARLKLGFNQIGSRGVNSLMRSLIACEAITFLELSGNVLKISGAVALAFTLAQHPRLEELELDDCCLGQAAQCHIVAGVISNRWVPMKRLTGFSVGPPMIEIGALDEFAQSLSNEECFRIRKDEQMKTILQWMERNRAEKLNASPNAQNMGASVLDTNNFLTPDFVSSINEVHGTPSQNAYLRLLGWLSRIPFDEDELSSLQKYFHDADGGDGERGTDGYVNLKLRGDLLAALDGDAADEIRDEMLFEGVYEGTVGCDLDLFCAPTKRSEWSTINGEFSEYMPASKQTHAIDIEYPPVENDIIADDGSINNDHDGGSDNDPNFIFRKDNLSKIHIQPPQRDLSCQSEFGSLGSTVNQSDRAVNSQSRRKERKSVPAKPRIMMFPMFETKLEELKAEAAEMIEFEEGSEQQEVILTQYAEASLTILRQLRYHCMNSGLDGWRQGGLKRKVLIVDDSKVTRKLVSRAFEKANFIVDTASNGAEGVEKLKKSIYDIAFMDIDMPVMNGFEATKKLRQWEDICRPDARQPICALTATYVDDFERSELLKFKEAGLDVMESKPCNIPRLFKVVDDVSPMFSDLSISVIQREHDASLNMVVS